MTVTDTATMKTSWLGLLRLVKPAKGQQVGIAYADWHHFAIIGDYVLLYIWDSREIIDAFPLQMLTTFETTKISDNGKQLYIGKNTSERAKAIVDTLVKQFDSLPIIVNGGTQSIADLKLDAQQAVADIDANIFNYVTEDLSTVFVPKTMTLPDNLYMYKLAPTLNPSMYKLTDPTSYLGRAKHYATIAHAYVLQLIAQLNS